MVATGVSGCGDGVLQTTEVASSPRDAGYPEPRIMSFDERMGRAGGISNLVQIFWGKADITTDFVEAEGRAAMRSSAGSSTSGRRRERERQSATPRRR
jgi:hypothetical protein